MKPEINRVITDFNNKSIQIIYSINDTENVFLIQENAHEDEFQRAAFSHILERLAGVYQDILEEGPPGLSKK